jgi:hypothetical protein
MRIVRFAGWHAHRDDSLPFPIDGSVHMSPVDSRTPDVHGV